MEAAARETGVDPAELRRRNFLASDAFPYQTPVALMYDSGNYVAALDKALEISDYAGIAGRKSEASSRGKLRGIGFSNYIEACGLAPSQVVASLGAGVGQWESAQVRFNPTGNVIVYTGSHSHGQGHETTFPSAATCAIAAVQSACSMRRCPSLSSSLPYARSTAGSSSTMRIVLGGIVSSSIRMIGKASGVPCVQVVFMGIPARSGMTGRPVATRRWRAAPF